MLFLAIIPLSKLSFPIQLKIKLFKEKDCNIINVSRGVEIKNLIKEIKAHFLTTKWY
jgi:hypothetical protein